MRKVRNQNAWWSIWVAALAAIIAISGCASDFTNITVGELSRNSSINEPIRAALVVDSWEVETIPEIVTGTYEFSHWTTAELTAEENTEIRKDARHKIGEALSETSTFVVVREPAQAQLLIRVDFAMEQTLQPGQGFRDFYTGFFLGIPNLLGLPWKRYSYSGTTTFRMYLADGSELATHEKAFDQSWGQGFYTGEALREPYREALAESIDSFSNFVRDRYPGIVRRIAASGPWVSQQHAWTDQLPPKAVRLIPLSGERVTAAPLAKKSPAKKRIAQRITEPRNVARVDTRPPVIRTPELVEANGTNGTAAFEGTVQDDSTIALFTINGREAALDAFGNFTFQRYIRSGDEKEFVLVAIDALGNRSTRRVTATRSDQTVVEEIQFVALDPSRSRTGRGKNSAVALVIGIEDYRRMPEASHARTDANVFRDYAHRALGVPRSRIVTLFDADADNIGIQDAVHRLGGLVHGDTDLYVFFAGHGFASGQGVPYLLPHDGDARYLSQLVSRNDLFESLADLRARSVTVFLDTCYSGRGRAGTVLAKGMRPLVIASSNEGVPEGFTVISAAASDEFSGDLPEAEHGLFSYYLMRGLGGEADGNGDRAITVEELHGYIAGEVGRQAARLGREQTPELFGERDRVLVRY